MDDDEGSSYWEMDDQERETLAERRHEEDVARLEQALRDAELWDGTTRRMVVEYGWDEAKAKKFMDLWPQKARELHLTGDEYWTHIWDFIRPIPLEARRQQRHKARR